MPMRSAEQYTVALQGFSEFERGALASFFRLAAQRSPSYVQVERVDRSDFVIADADQPRSCQSVLAAGRAQDTVFVGAQAPAGAMAWLPRPIEPVRIVRELDSLVEQRNSAPGELEAVLGSARVDVLLDDAFNAGDVASGPDVLVIENSGGERRFLQRCLQRLGYRVRLARDGDEAMVRLRRHAFALVILDIVLGPPGSLDGLKICHDLKRGPPLVGDHRPQVVILTALPGAMDRVRGTLAGCDAYLTKPLDEAEFIDTLRRLDPTLLARGALLR